MKYFKNTELAKLYHVSEKSVRNWIQATLDGKLSLQLYGKDEKPYIANTSKNTQLIEQLVAKGKKYKNTRGYRVVTPTPKFYTLYTPKQILDIVSNLDIYRETPLQYCYFNSGAQHWDQYTHNLLKQTAPNSLLNTLQLLDLSMGYLDVLLQDCKQVNIIDIGVGNALPSKGVVEHFLERGLLKRYIGLDISKELLNIAERNVHEWFGGRVNFEGYIRDINYDRFDDLLVTEAFGADTDSTVNIMLFLGGTIGNFREPDRSLSTIHDSMGKKDLLFFSQKLDTERTRRYFEMTDRGNLEFDLLLKLLNIDESLYTLEQFFDEKKMARHVQARLNVALAIKFQLDGRERVLEFNKGETILLLRMRHQNALSTIEQYDANGFELLQATRSKNQEHLLSAFRIKTGNNRR